MKRLLVRTLLVATLLLVGVVATVLLRAEPPLPPPDPATVIHLPDGSARPLAEVLDLAREGQLSDATGSTPDPAPSPGKDEPDEVRALPPGLSPAAAPAHARRDEHNARHVESQLLALQGTVFQLAEMARTGGRLDEAAALYLSIPEDDPWYADARRQLAWHVLAKEQGQPRRAVPYAHDALIADPLDGNAWEDCARVYAATLGLALD